MDLRTQKDFVLGIRGLEKGKGQIIAFAVKTFGLICEDWHHVFLTFKNNANFDCSEMLVDKPWQKVDKKYSA